MSSSGQPILRVLKDDDDHDWFGPHKNRYDFNSKIMITAIISLSAVVLLVLGLHIYARYVLHRQSRRRRTALRHLGLTVAHARSAAEPPPPKTGLEPWIIASLPIFAFDGSTNTNSISSDDDDHKYSSECAVCLCNLEEGEMARLLPNCNHTFHAECIDKWLSSQSTCPICRTEAKPRPRLEPEPREGLVATAPPLEPLTSSTCMEGTSTLDSAAKINNGSSGSNRLSSFRRMLSRERSSRRIQPCGQEDVVQDIERQ